MKKMRRLPVLLAAAAVVSTLLVQPRVSTAQYRLNDDGHLNDANNRIGSGGYNGGRDTFPNGYGTGSNMINNGAINNNIISGNVTGLKYFHGPAPQDPNEFAESTGTTQTDRFLAISGPQNITARTTGAQDVTPFYSQDRLATPLPSGLMPTSTGAAVPANPTNTNVNATNDTRLGTINNNSINNIPLPAPGELDLPGPVDASGNASSLIASPLYGMRQWSPTDASDAYFMSRYTNVNPNSPLQQAATNSQIMQMRQELNDTVVQNPNQAGDQGQGNAGNKIGTNNNLAANSNIGAAGGTNIAPANANLSQSQQLGSSSSGLASSAIMNQPLNTNVSGQSNMTPGTRQQLLVLVPADQQSAQLKDLEQRLSNRQHMTPEQSAQAYNEENRLNSESKTDNNATNTPNAQAPSNAPGGLLNTPTNSPQGNEPPKPADANTPPPPMNPMLSAPVTPADDRPYVITSLATGIKAKGLADLLQKAETQMRDGKFSAALQTYDMARAVAPNNPFATLGRALAELGASSYGQAERDLRSAFSLESGAVLVGVYDLRGFLGEDRLKFVVRDLKEINNRENNERSAFLLAFIAHNLGDNENAGRLLNDAEKRAGGQDQTIDTMRDMWQLKK